MLPSFPTTFKIGDRFPYPEGLQFEFKENNYNKMIDTICAFLNTVGGYYIIGINDAGIVRGINRAMLDKCMLLMDSVFREERIVNATTKEPVSPSYICAESINVGNDKYLMVVRVIPTADDTIWQTKDCIWRRMNASNCSGTTSQRPDASIIHSLKDKNAQLEHAIRECSKEFKEIQIKVIETERVLRAEIASAVKECTITRDLLYTTILAAKDAKEKELAAPSLLSTLTCGIL